MHLVGKVLFFLAFIGLVLISRSSWAAPQSLLLDFNGGQDSHGSSEGLLKFNGAYGFNVTFDDDGSDGYYGGQADGVHITNQNWGNEKAYTDDLVLGAWNTGYSWNGQPGNFHSSGIVANFSQGVTKVSLFDTDNDDTVKRLFAFDVDGNLIYQTAAMTQTTFMIDTSMTGGELIHSVEFDTEAGIAGGAADGYYFTLDDFYVEYDADPTGFGTNTPVPEPATLAFLAMGAAAAGVRARRRRQGAAA